MWCGWGGKPEGGDKRGGGGTASSLFFQGRLLNLWPFKLVQNRFDNHQRRRRGHLRLLRVSFRGDIQNNEQNSAETT